MIPSEFVILDELPLTPNGKVDRQALGAFDLKGLAADETSGAPRSPLEEVLVGIWRQALDVEHVGIHDNFFKLGGHSLLATQLLARACGAFEIELPLRTLFEEPTVAHLAGCIEQARQAKRGLVAPPLVRVSREQPLPLSYAQQRLWFLSRLSPADPAYLVCAALHAQGPLDLPALARSLRHLAARHESLRTRFSPGPDALPRQLIDPPPTATLTPPVRDLSRLPPEARERALERRLRLEARRGFDLAAAPPWRLTLYRLGESEQVAVLVMHHIIGDAWSAGVLVRELGALYAGVGVGGELAVQYADYAVWQRGWLRGEVLDNLLAFWRRQLAGCEGAELRGGRWFGGSASRRAGGGAGGVERVELGEGLSAELRALSRAEGATLFMTLLAGFQTLLHLYTEQEEIITGTNVANRTRAELEGLIGFFVNMLALRTSFRGNPTFRELLARVRETAFEAYEHQDLPFDKLVEALNLDRDLNRSPLFQVVFTLQNAPVSTFQFGDLTLTPLEVEKAGVKYDMVFNMWDGGGLKGLLEYDAGKFSAAMVKRLLEHFQLLLTHVAARPDARLSELGEALDTYDERQRVLRARELKEVRAEKFERLKKRQHRQESSVDGEPQ